MNKVIEMNQCLDKEAERLKKAETLQYRDDLCKQMEYNRILKVINFFISMTVFHPFETLSGERTERVGKGAENERDRRTTVFGYR